MSMSERMQADMRELGTTFANATKTLSGFASAGMAKHAGINGQLGWMHDRYIHQVRIVDSATDAGRYLHPQKGGDVITELIAADNVGMHHDFKPIPLDSVAEEEKSGNNKHYTISAVFDKIATYAPQ